MKIFLIYLAINSPESDFVYSYGLGYIAAVLKRERHDIEYISLKNKEDTIGLYEKIKKEKPEMVGFSSTTDQFQYINDIAKTIKTISGTFIVCGGIHPTLEPSCIDEIPELDAIVRGEGEYAIVELVNALKNKKPYSNIRNFWFRENDKIIKNEIRPLIKNLDELPFPDKDSLDYQRVIDNAGGMDRLIFSRGCKFECPYCSNGALKELYGGTYFRRRSPEKAVEEIKLEESKYRFRRIFFDDDLITIDKNWFYDFFNLYKKQFKYKFQCNIRPGIVDVDMVKLLKEANCVGVNIGIEHGNEHFRKTVLKRNITNKQILDTFRLFVDHGITQNRQQIMHGLPFESRRLFLDTVRLCRQTGVIHGGSIFSPYPGTEFYKICKKNNWMLDKKDNYRDRQDVLVSYPGFDKKDIRLCHDMYNFLLRHKSIPLFIPLEWLMVLRQSRFIRNIIFVLTKIKKNYNSRKSD